MIVPATHPLTSRRRRHYVHTGMGQESPYGARDVGGLLAAEAARMNATQDAIAAAAQSSGIAVRAFQGVPSVSGPYDIWVLPNGSSMNVWTDNAGRGHCPPPDNPWGVKFPAGYCNEASPIYLDPFRTGYTQPQPNAYRPAAPPAPAPAPAVPMQQTFDVRTQSFVPASPASPTPAPLEHRELGPPPTVPPVSTAAVTIPGWVWLAAAGVGVFLVMRGN